MSRFHLTSSIPRQRYFRRSIKIAGAATVGLLLPSLLPGASAESTKPNILLILSDDQGWGDAGFRGAPDVKTPNLDRLAASGVEFTEGYVSSPQCVPSRASLITGRYPQRVGLECNPDYNKSGIYQIDENAKTIAGELQRTGYRTGMIGKWHLGEPATAQPGQKGFEWCAYMRNSMCFHFSDKSVPTGSNWFRNAKDEEIPIEGNAYFTELFTDKALEFLALPDERPFFLYLAYHPPHWPLDAPEESIAKYWEIEDANRQICAAMISDMDAQIGRIIDDLKSTGRLDNTIIVFLSDNGAPEYHGPAIHPVKMGENASINGILNGCKGMLLEGGIRVPFVISWPANLPAKTRIDWPISSMDLTPTLLAAAEGEPLKEVDGLNLLPYLLPEISTTGPERALFWRFDTQWDRQNAIRRGEWKLVRSGPSPKRQLFNLKSDPRERVDLAATQPEIYQSLAHELDAWMATLPDPNPEWITVKPVSTSQ